jgi:serine phosphatase RsbU (regulator of sigma subunit)/CRP-like cAMP-binding protein
MNDIPALDRLRLNILFENVGDAAFQALRPKLKECRFGAGAVIVEDESEGTELYLIGEGRVRIVKKTQSGEENLLALLHEGDFFGELELVDGRPRSARVIAMERCVLYALHKDDFDHLLQTSHPFAIRLMQVMSLRLRSSNTYFINELERSSRKAIAELRHMEQLNEAATVVNSTLDLDKLLSLILDTALKIVEGDRGTLYLLDEKKQELWSKVLRGAELVTIRLPLGKGIAGYVGATGDTLNISDAYLDPRFNPEFDKKTGYRTQTILCMPMRNKDGKIIGVLQLLNKKKGLFTKDDEHFINALSIHASIAIENARLYEAEKAYHRMREEVRLAARIQGDLLPKVHPQIDGYDVAGTSIPAQEVGGDYFDYIPVDKGQWAVCLGDVSGKGLPASLVMANLQATLRGQTYPGVSVKDCVARSNRLLHRSTSIDKFVTLFYGILDTASHRLTFSNAGHDNPYFLSDGRPDRRLSTGGIVLGAIEEFPFQEESIEFHPGDLLVVYSDGIAEAMNKKGDFFGEERIAEAVAKHRACPAAELMEKILSTVRKFVGKHPQSDDMTLLILKRRNA